MNPNNPPQKLLFLLSELVEDAQISQPATAGQWHEQSWEALANVASSLAISAASQKAGRVSSIPSIWAQPLLMEMALHDQQHPLRQQMIAQWQGMLAAIALKELRNFPLKAKFIDLTTYDEELFAKSLSKLPPNDANCLYSIQSQETPWHEVYVLLWEDKAVGMTSPSTLVCPATTGQWPDLQWFVEGKLVSPTQRPNWLDPEEKELLSQWINKLKQELDSNLGSPAAISNILTLLTEFQNRLQVRGSQRVTATFLQNSKPFGDQILLGNLKALNEPIQLSSKPSSVQLCSRLEPNLYIIPNSPELLTSRDARPIEVQWRVTPQQIRLYDTTPLSNLKREEEELKTLAQKWNMEWVKANMNPSSNPSQGRLIDEKDLFLQEFYFVTQAPKDAFPGGLLPSGIDSLTYEDNQPITPLLPINPLLLEYFTSETLVQENRLRFELVDSGTKVRVILNLPLSGLTNGNPPQNYEIHQDYLLKKENALENVPVIEIWPDFQAEGWQEYYLYYWNRGQKENIFDIQLPSQALEYCQELNQDRTSPTSRQLAQLKQFPNYLSCQNAQGQLLGLVLLKSPPEVGRNNPSSWTVGFDFGTSFSNAYFEQQTFQPDRVPERLTVTPNLYRQITKGNPSQGLTLPEERQAYLLEYFTFTEKWTNLPIASILTTQGGNKQDQERNKVILDGRIYSPDLNFRVTESFYHPNLKWSQDLPKNLPLLFLKHLALIISAEAAYRNVREIDWCISYPSSFSLDEQDVYGKNWEDIIQNLNHKTGIKHTFDRVQGNHFLTESLAFAQYFTNPLQQARYVNTVFIDLGGGTSDISVWENRQLIYQCSLKLAGQHLFTQFLAQDLKVLELLFEQNLLQRSLFNPDDQHKLSNLLPARIYALLDILLKSSGEDSLNNKRQTVRSVEDQEKIQSFDRLIQLSELGLAGLFYYIGLLLNALHDRPNENGIQYENPNRQLPDLYLGGNGCRILDWISNSGKFSPQSSTNLLLREMLALSSSFNDMSGTTELSRSECRKGEVASGLILAQTKPLFTDNHHRKYDYIAGEVCNLGDNPIQWSDYVKITSEITTCDVAVLMKLPEFLAHFYQTWQENNQDTELLILGQTYTPSPDMQKNPHLWNEVKLNMKDELLSIIKEKDPKKIRFEPIFILGLKALLKVLGKKEPS